MWLQFIVSPKWGSIVELLVNWEIIFYVSLVAVSTFSGRSKPGGPKSPTAIRLKVKN